MKKLICIILISIFVISISTIPSASRQIYVKADESYQWVPINNGLYGGGIHSIAIDPVNSSIIYVGIQNSVIFKSLDGGSSWGEISNGLTSTWFNSIAIDPSDTNIIYAGGGYLFKSTDGGNNWNEISKNSVNSIAIDPNNTQIIYAGGWRGLFKSTNGGTSWKTINTGFPANFKVNSLAIDHENTSIIYAGTYGNGVFKSTDGGSSWSSINTGLTKTYVNSLAIEPKNSQIIYAGTWNGGVFKSSNSGLSWIQVNKGLTKTNLCVEFLAIDSKNTQTIYAAINSCGVFKSTDGGDNWSEINIGLTNSGINYLAVDPINTQIVYAGTAGGIFKSTDSGDSWNKMSNGITSNIRSPAVDLTDSQVIYAGVEGDGVYKSIDGGISWSHIWLSSLSGVSLAIDSKNTKVVYAGTNGLGIYKSLDGGLTWKSTWLSSGYIYSIIIDPTNSQVVYAGTEIFYYGPFGCLFKSLDGGTSWVLNSNLSAKSVYSLVMDPINTQTIYASTDNGIFKSTDGANSWSKISNTTGILFIDPQKPNTLYVSDWQLGIFKSIDGGNSWNKINSTAGYLAVDPKNTDVIYAGTNNGILRSTDGGTNWTSLNKGLDDTTQINSILIDPNNTSIIYAATNKGIYKYLTQCTIKSSSNVGGQITPSGSVSVPLGGTQNFTITPNTGYRIKQILVDGNPITVTNSSAMEYTFTDAKSDHTIEAVFEPVSYDITASSSTGGSISPSGTITVNYGDSKTFTITPNQGYKIKDVLVDGTSVGAVNSYTFNNVTSDHTIQASFEQLTFTITASASTGGTISPSGTVSVNYGGSITFNIMPATGYRIFAVKVDGKSVGAVSTYTFNDVVADHTIEATFEKEKKEIVIILQIGNKKFTVNGETRTLDSPPIIKNNRTLLPIRAVVEALGGTVGWDATERKVTISLSSTTIELWIGKSIAKVNGIDTSIDETNPKVMPEIINSRTMLPLRFVTENLGCTVEWDGTNQTITIRYRF